MEYKTVFDVAQAGYRQLPFVAAGLVLVAASAGQLFFRGQRLKGSRRAFVLVYLGVSVVFTVAAFVGTSVSYGRLASDLSGGRCQVTEGIVTEFDPMPHHGHKMESFVVAGRRFEYSDYVMAAGFNNTASHGGPIREGLRVRIHHRGNDIARLQIAR